VSEAFATTRHFQRLYGRSFRPPQDGATAIKVWIYPPGPYGASINRAPALWRDKLASVYRLYEDMGLNLPLSPRIISPYDDEGESGKKRSARV
jgi:hypothetical protein